jgi:hypothetical protein
MSGFDKLEMGACRENEYAAARHLSYATDTCNPEIHAQSAWFWT